MTIGTIVRYLVGQREAILEIAGNRLAPLVGLLFVISAAFAREYDGADLRHEPWHLGLPLVASIGSSLLLFLLIRMVAWSRGCPLPGVMAHYRSFLGLYWLTAPLAWLYALPVERWLSPAAATEANLWLLAIVSLWRVLLITRVVSVVFQTTFVECFFVVMFFADSLLLAILWFTPLPIFDVMGGIRLSPSERVIRDVACTVQIAAVLSWLVWAGGTGWAFARKERPWCLAAATNSAATRIHAAVWLLATAAVLVWLPVLPLTQPPQRLRWQVEHDLRSGRIAEGVALMSAHERADFPPHWDPPPRLAYPDPAPPVAAVLRQIIASGGREWVKDLYVQKIADNPFAVLGAYRGEIEISNEDLAAALDVFDSFPEEIEGRWYLSGKAALILEDETRPIELRDRLRKWVEPRPREP